MTLVADGPTPPLQSHLAGWLFFAVLVAALAACGEGAGTHRLQGATMGTTWHVTYTGEANPEAVTASLEAVLESVNASMSTYRADSEISRINAGDVGQPVVVSPAFSEVLQAALDVGARSAGAYDITVGPLVDLWGFGANSDVDWQVPLPEQVRDALRRVGQSALAWDEKRDVLTRRRPVRLDFSSIAKGYGVDRMAEALEAEGLENYLVEVGGEMRVAGVSPRGDLWRIAVEKPVAGQRGIARALDVTDIAIATSGDYRNFVEAGGERYSHTLDPRTGYPVTHDLVSVTVLHERCMMADAWATALSVAGAEEALRLAKANDLAVFLMTRDGNELKRQASPAFTARFGAVDGE